MKPKVLTLATGLILLLFFSAIAQSNKFPNADLYNLDGKRINAATISNNNMPLLLVFFKTNDNKCRENLFSICEAHEEVLVKKGVKVVAVCVDCTGRVEHVKPFIYGHDLDIEVYTDKNGNFKRAMGIADAPYTILYDHQMKIYCQQIGYCAGSEEMVCEKVNECLKKMAIGQ